MLKRLFGGRHKTAAAPAPASRGPRWAAPQIADADRFALHLHSVPVDEAAHHVGERYLLHGAPGQEGALLSPHGAWVSARFPRGVVQGLGFNRLASQIASETGAWVVGYRLFAGEGMDVHLFRGSEHVEHLALSGDELEWEPDSPTPFAALADVGHVVPRPPTQHPLDFLFALLDALGIADAPLTWEEALARHQAGTLPGSRLLRVGEGAD